MLRALHINPELPMHPRLTILAVASLLALPVAAQSIKPGLWETNNKMTGGGKMGDAMAKMQQQMANMPPEQRKMIEDMMKSRGVTVGAGGGVIAKICLTKEMIARQQLPVAQKGNCITKHGPMSKSMNISFTCTNPDASGEGTVNFSSDTAYSSTMNVQSSASGQPETMTMQSDGRWLGADCGSIKPVEMPEQK